MYCKLHVSKSGWNILLVYNRGDQTFLLAGLIQKIKSTAGLKQNEQKILNLFNFKQRANQLNVFFLLNKPWKFGNSTLKFASRVYDAKKVIFFQ